VSGLHGYPGDRVVMSKPTGITVTFTELEFKLVRRWLGEMWLSARHVARDTKPGIDQEYWREQMRAVDNLKDKFELAYASMNAPKQLIHEPETSQMRVILDGRVDHGWNDQRVQVRRSIHAEPFIYDEGSPKEGEEGYVWAVFNDVSLVSLKTGLFKIPMSDLALI
jgi:hypothetical protein